MELIQYLNNPTAFVIGLLLISLFAGKLAHYLVVRSEKKMNLKMDKLSEDLAQFRLKEEKNKQIA